MANQAAQSPPLLATLVATSLGAGFVPLAPGTAGTLTAVPLAWALGRLGPVAFVLGTVCVALVGWWSSAVFVRASGKEDDQRIVIDEVAGYLVTLLLVPRRPIELAIGFVLFRVLDTWKPPPVRMIDRRVAGGLGVMGDDLAAGVYGAVVLWLLESRGAVAWISDCLSR